MALDFEQLTDDVKQMASAAGERDIQRRQIMEEILTVLNNRGDDIQAIDRYVTIVRDTILSSKNSRPFSGAAYPLQEEDSIGRLIPLKSAALPDQATVVAVDGSQIVPDRHSALVYYLINIGAIIFHHGQGRAPEEYSRPMLKYPGEDEQNSFRFGDAASVSVERDIEELKTLAQLSKKYFDPETPLLTIMDQRLLYVPIGELAPAFKENTIIEWQHHLTSIRDAGGLVIGYVDRPGKAAVLTLLRALSPEGDWQDPGKLGSWDGLTDAEMFAELLAPGERSTIFVNLSFSSNRFNEKGRHNEICFFYLNVGSEESPNIARIDMPRWVATNLSAVAMIQALLVDQCQILGKYPYVLARADEIAVVGRQDQADLEFRMARQLDQVGLQTAETAKQQLKGVVRGGKIRHGV